jgi:hypothetical protein
MMRFMGILVFLATMFTAVDVSAQPTTLPWNPGSNVTQVVSFSGSFVLTSDIWTSSGDGIVINASNVTLDLNGFSVYASGVACTPATRGNSCTGTGTRAGIRINGSYVTVKNGRVWGWNGDGINVSQATGNGTGITLQNLQVHDNNNNGIYAGVAANTRGQIVLDNVIANNNGGNGILGVGVTGSKVAAVGNNGQGINLFGALTDSYAGYNKSTGILSNGGSLSDDVAIGNGDGFNVNGAALNLTALSNLNNGVNSGQGSILNSASDGNAAGFALNPSTCYLFVETYGNTVTPLTGGAGATGSSPNCLF